MKLFKKVMAVVLVGAMAVSMLTACGSSSSKTKDIKKALKDVGATTTPTLNTQADTATNELQAVTKAVTDGKIDLDAMATEQANGENTKKAQDELKKLTQFTFANSDAQNQSTGGAYDLYIWTNASENPITHQNYKYLMKVDPLHVNTPAILSRLLSKDFVQKGEFKGTSGDMDILKKLIKGANAKNVGISCEKVYGYDVLLVTVPVSENVDFEAVDIANVTL